MSDFYVKTNSLNQASAQLMDISGRIEKIAEDAGNIVRATRSTISSRLVESGKAAIISASVFACASDMRKLSSALKEVSETYETYERKVAGIETASKESEKKDSEKKDIKFDVGKLFKDMAKKLGIFGMAYSAGESFGKGVAAGKWSDIAKGLKSTWKAFSKNWDVYKDLKRFSNLKPPKGKIVSVWAKKVFNFESYAKTKGFTASKAKSFSTRWYNNLQKVKSAEVDELGKKFTTKSGIIGTIISAGINGLCNYEEYKNGKISGWRAVGETVVETGVDLALATGLGIAVGTVGATIGAPAVAVAAGVVAINAGLNFATEKLSGGKYDSFTEFASDSIIDGAVWVKDKAVEAYNGVKDTAVNCYNTVKNGITAGWKKIFG